MIPDINLKSAIIAFGIFCGLVGWAFISFILWVFDHLHWS